MKQECKYFPVRVGIQFPSTICRTDYKTIEWSWHPCQNQLTIDVWVNFQTLNSISLIYVCIRMLLPYGLDYYSLVVSFIIRNFDFSSLGCLVCLFSYSRFLTFFSHEFQDQLVNFCKKKKKVIFGENLVGINLNLQINLGSIAILIVVCLLNHEHECLSIQVFFNFYPKMLGSFQCILLLFVKPTFARLLAELSAFAFSAFPTFIASWLITVTILWTLLWLRSSVTPQLTVQ